MSNTLLAMYAQKAQDQAYGAWLDHGSFAAPHHAYGVLLEEIREVESEVFRKKMDRTALINELIDVATVCIRYAAQLHEEGHAK
jgi:NTP pyrophosphatase (non-canonical NTP hydrolase)